MLSMIPPDASLTIIKNLDIRSAVNTCFINRYHFRILRRLLSEDDWHKIIMNSRRTNELLRLLPLPDPNTSGISYARLCRLCTVSGCQRCKASGVHNVLSTIGMRLCQECILRVCVFSNVVRSQLPYTREVLEDFPKQRIVMRISRNTLMTHNIYEIEHFGMLLIYKRSDIERVFGPIDFRRMDSLADDIALRRARRLNINQTKRKWDMIRTTLKLDETDILKSKTLQKMLDEPVAYRRVPESYRKAIEEVSDSWGSFYD